MKDGALLHAHIKTTVLTMILLQNLVGSVRANRNTLSMWANRNT